MASGKSTVAGMLRQMGAEVMSLDDIARDVRSCPEVAEALANRFGADILDADGHPIPRLLAQRAFVDADSTASLNAIMHPAIAQRAREYLQQSAGDAPVRVLEVPLLAEATDLVELADEALCVIAPFEVRVQRAIDRGMSEDDARKRMGQQADDQQLRDIADTVILNDGSLEDLRQKVQTWWNQRAGGDAADAAHEPPEALGGGGAR